MCHCVHRQRPWSFSWADCHTLREVPTSSSVELEHRSTPIWTVLVMLCSTPFALIETKQIKTLFIIFPYLADIFRINHNYGKKKLINETYLVLVEENGDYSQPLPSKQRMCYVRYTGKSIFKNNTPNPSSIFWSCGQINCDSSSLNRKIFLWGNNMIKKKT